MNKYLINRILRGLLSLFILVVLVMVLIFSAMDRELIFAQDPVYSKRTNNARTTYTYSKWEEYGYIDYVTFQDYIQMLTNSGEIDEETRSKVSLGRTADQDTELTAKYVAQFYDYYQSQGYEIIRKDAIMQGRKVANGGVQLLFASKDRPLISRVIGYFTGLISVDNIHKVQEDIGERGLTFTLHDPAYGGEKFSPAIIGNGTMHKYLLYFDSQFPFIHQNLVNVNLGKSFVVNKGIDVLTTMTQSQGSYVTSMITYPTGLQEMSADDLHTATYVAGSLDGGNLVLKDRFVDDYTNVTTYKGGMSKMGFSFVIGILSVLMAYALGLPIGILMAQHKDSLIDKIGTVYIVFIIAVPSLSYIFLFKAIGYRMGLPTTFNVDSENKLMYILPIVSLALPSVANLMKWMRRYMIDQMNSDYVKFARSGGLSEGEIFRKHVMKNAVIPIVHGIPGSVLGCLVGAIITERVYSVPGTGNLLNDAIHAYDNNVIVGVTMFYAILSVTAIILGDILMSMVDPRISFKSKAR